MASLTPINEFLINWYYSYERLLQITGFSSKWWHRGKGIKKISEKRKPQEVVGEGGERNETEIKEGKEIRKRKGKGKDKIG